ncbi:MFS transporter [Sporolactobacillus terrae]|uniref:D-galactonate transport protein n=1 Tax=Sporolactobacillus terrae TaxID=269673 RepID=A0A5K7WWA2_9BACL|nr:MFS transporter [Sporolactobacillus terrae]BBN97924.1 D-galactonate transport protein [Sporolactobacillus terrae]
MVPNEIHSKRTNVRWKIGILMWLAITINYLDRANLSAASPDIMRDLHINSAEMGIVMSAFFWSYMIFQIPSGWLADKVGHRISMSLAVAWWSIATAITGLAHGLASLIGLRVLLGVGEAGAMPSNSGIATRWFPDHERGKISAFYDTGSKVGTAIAMPLIVWIVSNFGWKFSFVISGMIGLFWVIAWIWYYNDPEKQKYINKEELSYIRDGQKKKEGLTKEQPMKWYQLFKYRNVWAMCFGFFTLNYAIFFFITWFPAYLVEERGMAAMTMGFTAMIPPLAGIAGEMLGGWTTDYLYFKKQKSLTFSRKFNLVIGMLLATSILFAGITQSIVVCIALLSLSYAGLAFAAAALWCLPGDVAPQNMTSTLGGVQNCASNFGGIIGPIVTGFIITATGSFVPALVVSGIATLLGALTYLFWLGKVEAIKVGPKVDTNNVHY